MNARFVCHSLPLVLLAASGSRAADLKLPEVEKRIVEAAAKIKSVRADMFISVKSEGAVSFLQSEGKGTYEYAARDAKRFTRTDMESTGLNTVGESETRTHIVQTIVSDGTHSLIYGAENGVPMAFKVHADPMQTAVPTPGYFDALRGRWDLRFVGEEKVEGHDVWVIEGKAKNPDTTPAVRSVSYYRKDCGVMVRTRNFNKMDRVFQTTRLVNLKLDADLPASRFAMTAPDGVEVVDATVPSAPLAPVVPASQPATPTEPPSGGQ